MGDSNDPTTHSHVSAEFRTRIRRSLNRAGIPGCVITTPATIALADSLLAEADGISQAPNETVHDMFNEANRGQRPEGES